MAEGVTPPESAGTELETRTGSELETRQSKELAPYVPQQHGHETRFRMMYAVLAGVGLAAVALAAIFVIAGKPPKPPAWSQWKPSASGDAALGQIAEHIAPAYRLPTGEQLVAINGGPLQFAGFPARVVLMRTPDDPQLADGKGALFILCGLGSNCSIRVGKATQERGRLLQREALELALYSFHYVKDLKHVVVLMPPKPKKTPTRAMFFERGDVKPQLDRPLRATLGAHPPSIPSLKEGTPQADAIEKLTGSELYFFKPLQTQDVGVLLELSHSPLPSDGSNP
jgi:hypothetical protein